MFAMSLFGHHPAQAHGTAASALTELHEQETVALRYSTAVMSLALSVLVCFASGALAQVQELSQPTPSSGLREARSVPTPGIGTPGYRATPQSLFDASSLPPIASIGAGSDIRPFLAPGVPQDLTRAALRRAWSTDPAIRDFIGLSENSSDFNAPDAVSGFGPSMDEAGRLSARPAEDAKDREPTASQQSAARLNRSWQ